MAKFVTNNTVESPRNLDNVLECQLSKMFGEASINELPLDLIETVFFEDLYEREKILGAGTFGIVIKVKEKLTNNEYAMKVFFYCCKTNVTKIISLENKKSELGAIFNEAKLLSIVDHPNILKLRKVHTSKKFLFIVTDLVYGGSLKSYIRIKQINREILSDEECSDIIKQILEGLSYIHNLNIVHRDIKPKNILIQQTKNKKPHVIIADLGLGIELMEYEFHSTTQRVGTVLFMAPEQFNGHKYTTVPFNDFILYKRALMFGLLDLLCICLKQGIIRFMKIMIHLNLMRTNFLHLILDFLIYSLSIFLIAYNFQISKRFFLSCLQN